MSKEKLSVFPMGEKNDAYARYFVGQSYLKMLTTEGVAIGNVTFCLLYTSPSPRDTR